MVPIAVALLAAAALTVAAAEQVHAQGVLFGGKGGVSITDLSVESDGFELETDSRTGFIGGVFANFGLGDVLALQPEVLYASKGADAEDEGIVAELRADYLEIPVLLVARIPVGESGVRPLLFAGGAVSFETSCGLSGTDGTVSVSVDCDDPEIDLERKKTDLGLIVGGGLEVETGGVVLTVDGRYNLGLVDIDEDAASSIKHRAFSIMAGIGVRLGGRGVALR